MSINEDAHGEAQPLPDVEIVPHWASTTRPTMPPVKRSSSPLPA